MAAFLYKHFYNDHVLDIIHSFFYMSVIVLGVRDRTVNETDKYSFLSGAYILMEETANK